MSGVIHLKDHQYLYPACGQPHENIVLTARTEQVTCECCKRTAQYLNTTWQRPDEPLVPFLPEVVAQACKTVLARIAGTPLEPTPLQISSFTYCVEITREAPANHHASVRGEIDDHDGTMLVTLTEDGASQFGRFGRDGKLVGDWF